MATVSATIRIPASADRVWKLAGGFNSMSDWLPFIQKSELSEGGRLRSLRTESGEIIVERLETFNNAERTYTYSIAQGAFPVTDYVASFVVSPQGRDASIVEWSGSFTPEGVSRQEAEALFLGFYEDGLEALKANFE